MAQVVISRNLTPYLEMICYSMPECRMHPIPTSSSLQRGRCKSIHSQLGCAMMGPTVLYIHQQIRLVIRKHCGRSPQLLVALVGSRQNIILIYAGDVWLSSLSQLMIAPSLSMLPGRVVHAYGLPICCTVLKLFFKSAIREPYIVNKFF